MDDLIGRREAIEAIEFGITYLKVINKETGEVTEPFAKINEELREAVNRVKELPSAQPEHEEFEWCTDCKEYDQERHCCHRWTKVIRNTVDEIKAKPVGHAKLLNAHPYGECSNCGCLIDIREKFNYCPMCGYKIEVEE